MSYSLFVIVMKGIELQLEAKNVGLSLLVTTLCLIVEFQSSKKFLFLSWLLWRRWTPKTYGFRRRWKL